MAIKASSFKYIILALVLMVQCLTQAQAGIDSPPPTGVYGRSPTIMGLRRNIAVVFLSGIGGALLGLSTLSFYSDPSNHVSNITIGLGLGLVGGVSYVIVEAYKPQTESQLSLDPIQELQAKAPPRTPSLAQWSFEF
jgi:hypothetical protein